MYLRVDSVNGVIAIIIACYIGLWVVSEVHVVFAERKLRRMEAKLDTMMDYLELTVPEETGGQREPRKRAQDDLYKAFDWST